MIQHIRPAQLADWLASHNAGPDQALPIVLDVREPWELQTASVRPQGFELLHMPMSSVPARLNELPRERPIACLCHHGGRSAQVAFFLKNQGYDAVVNINGGIHLWSAEVDPTVPRY
ncbi:rhodanese-like domain-containing protein [Macromonas nakdongensis]|uniref:rhodanese-like domain-containing protein n=1 Tax=Macromonas nakdongensis TaxID=1843082 RepID=UPI000C33DDA1|nr:rhodanese-like domain-containing protein [Macromonas nakdongensis]